MSDYESDDFDEPDAPGQTIHLGVNNQVTSDIPIINCSQEELNSLLTALEVLAQINIGDKLIWNEDSIVPNIQYYGPLRPVRRYFMSNDRTICIQKLEEIVYKSINAFKFKDSTVRIREALLKINLGLSNLKTTYGHDKQICSQISIIIQNISSVLSKCND